MINTKTTTLLKVGLNGGMVNDMNSAMFDMRMRLPPSMHLLDIQYIDDKSQLHIEVGDESMVWTVNGDYITTQSKSYFTTLKSPTINVASLNILLCGFVRCCGELQPILKVQNIMVEDNGDDKENQQPPPCEVTLV